MSADLARVRREIADALATGADESLLTALLVERDRLRAAEPAPVALSGAEWHQRMLDYTHG